MTQNLREELRAWLRPTSPLTAFAQSLRMEGPGASQQSADASKAADDAQKVIDHFDGIDLDELPENVREAVGKARATIETSQKSAQSAEQRRAQAEDFARAKQSEADKLRSVVQRHNLDPSAPASGKPNLADAKFTERVDRLVKQGLKPEAAQVYAKMLADEAEQQRNEILGELGPLAGAVGGIQAHQHLIAAESKYASHFAVPEIAKDVRDNIAVMVSNGSPVNEKTVEHLVAMAVGSHTMLNPGKSASQTQPQQIPQVGGGGGMGGGGGHVSNANVPASSAPRVTQPETVTIMNALNSHMKQGLKPSKK